MPRGRGRQRVPVARVRERKDFLDIFSGVGHCAKCARARRLRATEFELRQGVDVLQPQVRAQLRRTIRQRRCAGVMFGTPCTSFTTARNRTRGPIRSKRRPRGLTHYSWGEPFREADRRALRLGNRLLDFTIEMLEHCNATGTPACLEQPRNSYMWADRKLRSVLKRGGVVFHDIDQCAYGRPWKKTTKLAFVNCHDADFGKIERARCSGKGGFCSYTKRRHVQLAGDARYCEVAPAKAAQAYPIKMASALVHTLLSRHRSQRGYDLFSGSLGH